MKTINRKITIHMTLANAEQKFQSVKSADLLYSEQYKAYYVDCTKQALKDWPTLYTLIKTK